jgi:hypothetical protein
MALILGIRFFRKIIRLLRYLLLLFVLNNSLVMKTSNADLSSGKPTSLPIYPCRSNSLIAANVENGLYPTCIEYTVLPYC